AIDHGMDVLIEVHDEAELERALKRRSPLIGVNNRDLRDFSVDISRTERLARLMPEGIQIVAESGLASRAELDRLAEAGVRRFLIGETLMRQPDLEAATRAMVG
ncbi:MAG TPA: indole-3-glycerol-phosphate synthase TrpC, partial [Sphingomonas sp.]|nr:indole-3-glycerol-phosphate synthase TrpC [Sphingomonas sp.]